jgi:group II intron reverse transcriptase/maturase
MPDKKESERHKPTFLQGIAKRSGSDPTCRFHDMSSRLSEDYLRDSWRHLNKRAAAGVDKVSIREYQQDLDAHIRELVATLKANRYKARLIRRTYIPKDKGKMRPLGIPVVSDRLLQMAVSRILSAIWEPKFSKFSFGYRPGKSAKSAVKTLQVNLQFGKYGYVVEADIKGFFDNISHEWLVRMLEEHIADRRFIRLIRKWLKAGVLEPTGQVIHPITGTPQGGVISPILANIYLHYVFDLWFEKVVQPRCKGKALFVRYADDFVCAFQLMEDANRFYGELPKRLGKFNLELSETKTRIIKFSRFQPDAGKRFQFLGFEYCWHKDRKGKPRVQVVTARKKLRKSLANLTAWVKKHYHDPSILFYRSLRRKLTGYYNYYAVIGNSRAVGMFWKESRWIIYKWLRRRGRRSRLTWERYRNQLMRHGIRYPRVKDWGVGRVVFV